MNVRHTLNSMQGKGLGPWQVTSNNCGHLFWPTELGCWNATNFNACTHMSWVCQQTNFTRHIFSRSAQGVPKFIITHCRLFDYESRIVLLALGEAQRRHCWLPYKAQCRQNDQQATKQHVTPDIGKHSRAQNDLKESQDPITTPPEASMHCFDGMAVMKVEIQGMSGHQFFLSLLADPLVEQAEVVQVCVALCQILLGCCSMADLWVQMGLSSNLRLLDDCLSAFTVARAESLSQTGRGPALRASSIFSPTSFGGRALVEVVGFLEFAHPVQSPYGSEDLFLAAVVGFFRSSSSPIGINQLIVLTITRHPHSKVSLNHSFSSFVDEFLCCLLTRDSVAFVAIRFTGLLDHQLLVAALLHDRFPEMESHLDLMARRLDSVAKPRQGGRHE